MAGRARGRCGSWRGRQQTIELRRRQIDVVEAAIEIARRLAQVAREYIGIEHGGEPARADETVHRRRLVEPGERQGRCEKDALVAHRLDALPERIGPDAAIEALVQGYDHLGVPC